MINACNSPLVTRGEKIKFDFEISSPTLLKSPLAGRMVNMMGSQEPREESNETLLGQGRVGVAVSNDFQNILKQYGKRKSIDVEEEFQTNQDSNNHEEN